METLVGHNKVENLSTVDLDMQEKQENQENQRNTESKFAYDASCVFNGKLGLGMTISWRRQ